MNSALTIKPPFNEETARTKVKAAQDAWNTRDPELVAKAYTLDSCWRDRTEFFNGKEAIIEFLKRKWAKELDYRLMKSSGAIPQIVFQYVLSMNGEMRRILISGCVHMAMNIGNSKMMD